MRSLRVKMSQKLKDAVINLVNDGKLTAHTYSFYKEKFCIEKDSIMLVEGQYKGETPFDMPSSLHYFCKTYFGNSLSYDDFISLKSLFDWEFVKHNYIAIIPFSSFEKFLIENNLVDVFLTNIPQKNKEPF